MDRNSVSWRGYFPAAPTPFAPDGAFDADAMTALMQQYVDAGVHGVLINGSSGEWWAQSFQERQRTVETALKAVDGRIPVIVGCTAFTADEVAQHAGHAAEHGASGVLTTPPPYAHPSDEEVLEFYKDVDKQVTLPLVAYNWPRGTAVDIPLDTGRRIADLEQVVAIKNSTGNWISVVDYIEALGDQVRIFASLINRRGIAILRELGGDGYIDGGALGAPFAVPFFDALWNDRLDDARENADKWWQLTSSLINPEFGGWYGAPSAQLKAAMRMLGQPGGEVRPPLQPVTDPDRLDAIRGALRAVGLPA